MGTSYKDLNIWKKGYELVLEVYKLSTKFPNDERFGLVDQLRRSANSVIANIAESHGRYFFADKCRVLYQARGECVETRSHLSVAFGLHYLDCNLYEKMDIEYEGLEKGISSYINKIKS